MTTRSNLTIVLILTVLSVGMAAISLYIAHISDVVLIDSNYEFFHSAPPQFCESNIEGITRSVRELILAASCPVFFALALWVVTAFFCLVKERSRKRSSCAPN